MSWRYIYSSAFQKTLSASPKHLKKALVDTVKRVQRLDDPKADGGEFGEKLWRYNVPGRYLLVCEIDDEAQMVRFRGVSI